MDRSFLEENGVDVNAGLELLGDMDMYNETMGDFLEEINEKLPKLVNTKITMICQIMLSLFIQ